MLKGCQLLKKTNMKEAIEKHEALNPKLFDNNALKPEIRKKAEEVVNEFLKILAEDEVKLKVRDVILTGSNASYNYTANSDVDLHILADTAQFDDPEQLHKKLYNCYRRLFESKFDITFYGIPVEIYVETEDNPVVSNGIYSVMYDKWVKEPTRDYVKEVDQKEIAEFAKP
jgi:predicted nucleotidyltransferase